MSEVTSRSMLVSVAIGSAWLVSGCSANDAAPDGASGGPSKGGSSPTAGASAGGSAGTVAAGSGGMAPGSAGSSAGAPTSGGSQGTSGSPSGLAGAAGSVAGSGGSASGASGAAGAGGSSGTAGAQSGSGGSGGGALASVRIVGRIAAGTNGAQRFSWPGVSIHARFSGTQVSMNLNDGNNKNRFTVQIDGGSPKTVTTTSAQSLQLASGLTNTSHELTVWRNTEASPGGVSQFSGLSDFGTGGALLPAAPASGRRIEVIGDSLSVGAGAEGTSTNCTPDINAYTNNYLAYGSVAARALNADLVTIAWSGIGVYRSYGGSAPTMPQRYDVAVPNDSATWDFTKYQPQAVVINLGTNDFSNGNPGQPYVDAYVAFVKHVRSKYAAANFVLIDMYGGDRLTAINNVVSALKSGGEQKVESLSFGSVPNNNTGCNQHPNVAAHAAMANLLVSRLKTLLSW